MQTSEFTRNGSRFIQHTYKFSHNPHETVEVLFKYDENENISECTVSRGSHLIKDKNKWINAETRKEADNYPYSMIEESAKEYALWR